jgi:hypothetical protein
MIDLYPMKNNTTKIGWVLRNRKTKTYLHKSHKYSTTPKLENALLFPSRSKARMLKEEDESVIKVALGKKLRILEGDFGSRKVK